MMNHGSSTNNPCVSHFTGFERCVEMKLPDAEGGDKEGLDEFTRKLRVCVGNSLGKQISFYQAEVDKLYESRAIPGWNYCNFFAAKVCAWQALSINVSWLVLISPVVIRKRWRSRLCEPTCSRRRSHSTRNWRTSSTS